MSSRTFARVLIQLLGLAMLVHLLRTILDLTVAFSRADGGLGRALVALGAPFVVFISVIWLFLRHASWIASALRIGSDSPDRSIASDLTWTPDAARRVGCILLGIYTAIPTIGLISQIQRHDGSDGPVPLHAPAPIVEFGLRLIVALLLIVGPGRVLSFLRRRISVPSRDEAADRP